MSDLVINNLTNCIKKASDLDSKAIKNGLSKPKDSKNGDFAFPCFLLAKNWKLNPAECAKKLEQEIELPDSISKAEAVGPYLNFFLDRSQQIHETIKTVLNQTLEYGRKDYSNQTIVIDYSSPNIAKPFHVGHLRTTIIGFALYNIFKHLGYNTVSVNHLGDWGTQFGFVYAGYKLWGENQEHDMDSLVQLYIKANQIRKLQDNNQTPEEYKDLPNINQMAKDYFIRLQESDQEAKEFWQKYLDISLNYLKAVYSDLGIEFDHYTGESFYIPMLDETKKELENSGLLEESEGAYGIDLGEKLGFARLLTEDGRTLYLTRDVTTATYREKTFSPAKLLYVVGNPQTLHFRQLKAIMKKLDHPSADKMVHIAYGHVPRIGTRNLKTDQDSASLSSLIKEAEEKALDAYKNAVSKRPVDVDEKQVSKSVALAAIYFNYLCRTNIKDFNFTWEEALNFQGDTGPYLLYTLARLNSIQSRAKQAGLNLSDDFNPELINTDEIYKIISIIADFPDALEKISQDYEPNHLAQYALSLAKTISKNYKTLRVIDEEDPNVALARLSLFTACKYVLEVSIKLLGIPPLERM